MLAACRGPANEPTNSVYVVDEFTRIRPKDGPGTRRVAHVSAARNEYAPFQIVVRAGSGGLKNVNAVASPLMGKSGHTIPADRITLYREHYIEIRKLSPRSKGSTGWYPDALIPFLDPTRGSSRYTHASPLRRLILPRIPINRCGSMCSRPGMPRPATTPAQLPFRRMASHRTKSRSN